MGVLLVLTGSAIVAVVYKDDARAASLIAEKTADKLIASGY